MRTSFAPRTFCRLCFTKWNGIQARNRSQKNVHNDLPILSLSRSPQWGDNRTYATDTMSRKIRSNMQCWQINQYGGTDQINLNQTAKVPHIKKPDEVLVEVHAASINPIDTLLLGGYGSSTWNLLRRVRQVQNDKSEFPLTLGRDFSGVIVATGKGASKFRPGDEVWGAVDPAIGQGTHAEFVTIPCSNLSRKPSCLSHTDATSIPYVALTTWSALCTAGGLRAEKAPEKRILVLGGSGGIGTFAIQLLKAWGADVVTTCSAEASELVTFLGVDTVIDYKATDARQELFALPRFDMILDTVGEADPINTMKLLKPNGCATYVTIVTPLLQNFDQSGFLIGGIKNCFSLGGNVAMGLQQGKNYRWAFFLPNATALKTVTKLVEQQKIMPIVEKVFPFSDIPAAFDKVMQKHNRGKTVIDFKNEPIERH